eukprot:gene29806-30279_t
MSRSPLLPTPSEPARPEPLIRLRGVGKAYQTPAGLFSALADVAGETVGGMDESRLAAWRGRTVGLVFQFFQLLPTLTIAENVI